MPERKAATTEVGYPGLTQYAGYIDTERDTRLRNRRVRFEAYDRMLNDATVWAGMTAMNAFMRSTGYVINPADDTPDGTNHVALVEECIDRMEGDWGTTFSQINSQNIYGFSIFEIVYDLLPDGRIGWKRWAPRAQATIDHWVFDDDGRELLGFVQIAPPRYKPVEIRFADVDILHFATERRNQSPEGVSFLRPMYDAWYFKDHISRIEAIGIEREMVGMPVMELPLAVMQDPVALKSWQDVMSRMRADEEAFMLVPSDTDENGERRYTFSLQNAGGQRAIDTNTVIARYERLILRTLLADFMTLGDQGTGSFALGSSRVDFFARQIQGILDGIADTINQQAIKPLCALNGIPEDQAPKFVFDNLNRKDMSAFAAAFAQLAGTGVIGLDDAGVRREVYDVIGLPAPDDGFDAMIDRVLTSAPSDTKALESGNTEAPSTFTEPLTDDLIARGKAAWAAVVDERWSGALDASLVEQ